jgi:hypothetical protein
MILIDSPQLNWQFELYWAAWLGEKKPTAEPKYEWKNSRRIWINTQRPRERDQPEQKERDHIQTETGRTVFAGRFAPKQSGHDLMDCFALLAMMLFRPAMTVSGL